MTARAGEQTLKPAAKSDPFVEQSRHLREAHRDLAVALRDVTAAHADDPPEVRRQAMAAFHRENRGRFVALKAQAKAVAESRPRRELPILRQIEIPEHASPALEELLVGRAQLRNEMAAIENRLRLAPPAERRQALRAWHERYAPRLAAQQQLARQVAAERPPRALPMLAELRIPPGASPEVEELLTERHVFLRAQQAIDARNLAPSERAQALRQWRENRPAEAQPGTLEMRQSPVLQR